jgi:LmbE family N-acetylglucosaminyl deacetylase
MAPMAPHDNIREPWSNANFVVFAANAARRLAGHDFPGCFFALSCWHQRVVPNATIFVPAQESLALRPATMLSLTLPFDSTSHTPQLLCLGAHSDDIEIGCGGTILRLTERFPRLKLHWLVFSATGVREAEARRGAELFAGSSRLETMILKDFRDGFMPYTGGEIKAVFEEIKQTVSPDLILTHNRADAHQDHRLISELTWNTFRNHMILEYEIPKYDGDMGRPNVFLPLEEGLCLKKTRYIMDAFQSQHPKHWFDENTFRSLMRLRGMECSAPSGYAEAFYSRKLVL